MQISPRPSPATPATSAEPKELFPTLYDEETAQSGGVGLALVLGTLPGLGIALCGWLGILLFGFLSDQTFTIIGGLVFAVIGAFLAAIKHSGRIRDV